MRGEHERTVSQSSGKDWTGNKTSVYSTIGARNFAANERVEHDYYATDPNALSLLLELDDFYNVWECAVGGGASRRCSENSLYSLDIGNA